MDGSFFKRYNMKFYLLFIYLLFNTTLIFAKSTATDNLINTFANIKTFQASFVQSLYGNNDTLIQKSTGLVHIQKPGKFRWDYRQPFEQLILSNSKELWIFDVEMDQATVKPVDNLLSSAPATLLGSNKPINETFNLQDEGERNGLTWVALTPKEKESDFNKILVGMDKAKIKVMQLNDNFGQVTQIQFNQIQTNITLDKSLFEFVPPKGVDVLGR